MSFDFHLKLQICLAITLFTLISCGTLQDGKPNLGVLNGPKVSGDPCRNADWFEVGRIDGLSGVPTNTSSYIGRCAAQGVAVDEELYTAGWQRGLVDYCTPDRAFDAGRAGESYAGVCPSHLEAPFLKRFKIGSQISALEKKNLVLASEVDRKSNELASLQASSAKTPTILSEVLSRAPSSETAEQQKSRLSQLQTEIQSLRDTVAKNETAIRRLESTSL